MKSKPSRSEKIKEAVIDIAGSDLKKYKRGCLWKAARNNKDHPLYGEFTWDKNKAAEKTWNEEERKLLSEVRYQIISTEGIKSDVRELISVTHRDPKNKIKPYAGLISRREILSKRSAQKSRWIDDLINELRQWVYRTGDIKELRLHREKLIDLLDMREEMEEAA